MAHPERPGVLPHYLSTACYHDLHDACRRGCKYCGETCLCKCHGLQPPMHVGIGAEPERSTQPPP